LNTGLNGAAATLMVYPSLDAIQEVKVLTSNYGAQYGRTASGTVQVTTKSGTPKFHGNLYEFIRNEAFNSRNFFDVIYQAPAAPVRLLQVRHLVITPRYIGGTILAEQSAGPFISQEFSTPRRIKPSFSIRKSFDWRRRRRSITKRFLV